MNIPIPFRLMLLFVAGSVIGAVVNAWVGLIGLNIRRYSPWLKPAKDAPPRRFDDRIPLVGWMGLRRESKVHGRGHWIAPMCVEWGAAIALPLLYWWEVVEGRHLFPFCEAPSDFALHMQFLSHAILFAWALTASVVDIYDRIIPDSITVSGVFIALVLAAAYPGSLLTTPEPVAWSYVNGFVADDDEVYVEYHSSISDEYVLGAGENGLNSGDSGPLVGKAPVSFLTPSSPNSWPDSLGGSPRMKSLAIACGAWLAWCLAVMPNVWYPRRGIGFALRANWASRFRRGAKIWWGVMPVGLVGVTGVWFLGGTAWIGLMAALLGMFAGGTLVWSVRIIAGNALNREAMGFGDVTLMAMIGAFLGWQPVILAFFIAPLTGVVIGTLNVIIRRDNMMPYGPFLCAGSFVVLVAWPSLWLWIEPAFFFPQLVPIVFVVCIFLMWFMLRVWGIISGRLE
jgi:leader peptidase (prepilin peptidase) / N-methyltransferase